MCMNLNPGNQGRRSSDWQLCVCVCVHRDEYFRMKVQWKSVSEEQEMRNSLLRGYRSLIGQFHLFHFLLVIIGNKDVNNLQNMD